MAPPNDWPTTGSDAGHATRRKVVFDLTINLGHVLTALAMLCAGFASWASLDKRMTAMEVETRIVREAQGQRDGQQDIRLRESVVEIKESIQRVERGLDESRATARGTR